MWVYAHFKPHQAGLEMQRCCLELGEYFYEEVYFDVRSY